MDAQERKNTISNIVGAMSGISGPKRSEIIKRQLALWTKVDRSLGAGIAAGIGIRGARRNRRRKGRGLRPGGAMKSAPKGKKGRR